MIVASTDYESLRLCDRINVIGTSGSGKSTFGKTLAGTLNLPYVEMDQLYWRPNWQEPSIEEFSAIVAQAVQQGKWILDGNYSRTTPIKWQRAETVIWLDLSFARTLFRVTKRSVSRAARQEEIWPDTGNRETFSRSFFSTNSVILWALRSHFRNRRRYCELLRVPEYEQVKFVRLQRASDVSQFIDLMKPCS